MEWGGHAPVHCPCDVRCSVPASGTCEGAQCSPGTGCGQPPVLGAWGRTEGCTVLEGAAQRQQGAALRATHRYCPPVSARYISSTDSLLLVPLEGLRGHGRGGGGCQSCLLPSPPGTPSPAPAIPVVCQCCVEPAGRDGLEAGSTAVLLRPGRQHGEKWWGGAQLPDARQSWERGTAAALTCGAHRCAVPPKTHPPAPVGPSSPATASTG